MKATFSRQALLSGISLTQSAVSSSGALPILSNVLIDAQGEAANLVGTDLETFAKVKLEARVEEAGRATVPAKTLAEIVRLLPDDDVAMVTSGTRMTLTCNRNVYQLATMNADDFPDWPRTEFLTHVTLRQADLKRLLRNTTFAIPQRDPRKVLLGALFQLTPAGLICVATDGRKLGKAIVEPIEIKGKYQVNAIIPGSVLEQINKAIGEEGEIEISITDRQAVFTLPNLIYLTSLIEGNFPNYEAVIPETFKKLIELPRAAFHDAIVRAGVLAERKFNSIILHFSRNNIDIQAQSFEDGSYSGQVEIAYDGEPFKIAFNHQYLHEVFRIISDAVVRMKVKDSIAPVVFDCESDLNSLYLVMPVRMHDLEAAQAAPETEADDEEDE